MADQNLLTIFIALTTLAVLIQLGILIGVFILSMQVSRQADRAMGMVRNLVGPLQNVADTLQAVSAGVAEFSTTTRGQLRQFESWLRRAA